MCEILINDLVDELSEENKRLLNELSFERQLNEVLICFRSNALVLINNCKCNQNINLFHDLIKFEKQFHSLNARLHEKDSKTIESNEVKFELWSTVSTQTIISGKSCELCGRNENSLKDTQSRENESKTSESNEVMSELWSTVSTQTTISGKSCDLCDYESNCIECLMRHMSTHCNIKTTSRTIGFHSKKNYINTDIHTTPTNNEQYIGSDIFKCNTCPYTTREHRLFVSHVSAMHPKTGSPVAGDDNSDTPSVISYLGDRGCVRTMNTGTQSETNTTCHTPKNHVTPTSSGNQFFRCDLCPFKTKYRQSLRKHATTHTNATDDRLVRCDICNTRLKSEQILKQHKKYMHSEARHLFTCNVCDYSSRVKANYRSHMFRRHSVVIPFVKRTILRASQPRHAFKCNECYYSSQIKRNLIRHMTTHTMDRLLNPGVHSPGRSPDINSESGEHPIQQSLGPNDVVWAKCKGYPWFPGVIVDPKVTLGSNVVPVPPRHVLMRYKRNHYLVNYFDEKGMWQWLTRNHLETIGVDSDMDRKYLTQNLKPRDSKAIRKAYKKMIEFCAKLFGDTVESNGH